jgi:hypothetical protein
MCTLFTVRRSPLTKIVWHLLQKIEVRTTWPMDRANLLQSTGLGSAPTPVVDQRDVDE